MRGRVAVLVALIAASTGCASSGGGEAREDSPGHHAHFVAHQGNDFAHPRDSSAPKGESEAAEIGESFLAGFFQGLVDLLFGGNSSGCD